MGLTLGAAVAALALIVAAAPTDWNARPTDGTADVMRPLGSMVGSDQEEQALQHFQNEQLSDQEIQAQQDAQIALDKATNQDEAADKALNGTWNLISADVRAQILPNQRAWITDTAADCDKKGTAASRDATIRKTVRLKCDTVATQARTDWLKQYLPAAH
jgi:uncharacterized protein YecT (DUF1311 family)